MCRTRHTVKVPRVGSREVDQCCFGVLNPVSRGGPPLRAPTLKIYIRLLPSKSKVGVVVTNDIIMPWLNFTFGVRTSYCRSVGRSSRNRGGHAPRAPFQPPRASWFVVKRSPTQPFSLSSRCVLRAFKLAPAMHFTPRQGYTHRPSRIDQKGDY